MRLGILPMRARPMVHMRIIATVSKRLRKFGVAARGVAGVEFAIMGPLLAIGLLNAVDVGYYAYERMEVENAAEMGAQAAWKNCNDLQTTMLPATQVNASTGLPNCPTLNATITAAIQSTSLGTAVTLASGYPTEGYYCVDSTNALQYQGSVSSTPMACSSGASPGDYIQVQVTYAYTPLFTSSVSVMTASGITSITKKTWMRMG
ncbi:MAG: hypothetical protein CR217_02955 [Beijerinckiaceae bacterium]|nr:MAG: hypothetical protein CR217_02955 [Beijerinckiaceae bacterium]